MPLPAHIHDSYSSGLELRTHLHVVKTRSSPLVHRLRATSSYAPDQIRHTYGALLVRFSVKDS